MNTLAAQLLHAAATLAQEAGGYTVSPQVAAPPQAGGLGDLFSDGGFMMWPITLCAVAVVALAGRAAWRMRSGSTEPLAAVRAGIDGVLFWGAYASVLGVLGTVVGITIAAQAVEAVGEAHARLIGGGIKVALITTIYGMLILLGGAPLWFGLRQWHHREGLNGA
ncbi:MAG TPA: MotA/TolQ/ExbB proton channel family protein [Longimicrobiales bacterium]|nr:MotA/TolQ/ExbB proton channel family protein [Longimicrobiales bacterium]